MKKDLFQRAAALAVGLGMTLSLVPGVLAAEETQPWYAEAQSYVTEKGLMVGTEKGFEPDSVVTYLSILQTLYNMEGQPNASEAPEAWYTDALAWWKDLTGMTITGEDIEPVRGNVKSLLDTYCAAKNLDGNGLMIGNNNGDMMQDKTLTRAEFAQILMRLDALTPAITAPALTEIDKYGDIRLSVTAGELKAMGFEHADLVRVKFLDQELTLPVIPEYRYVGAKAAAVVMWNDESKPVELEVFNGSFAETYGLAKKVTEDSQWHYEAFEGVEFPVTITIEMAEKGGYADTYAIFDLVRTNERDDYEQLTDEQFANFRAVTTTGMGEGKLYRASSPANPSIGRNTYADKAAEAAGVKSFVNLADSAESAAKYEGYAESYYSQQNVLFLNLGVDFTTELNRQGVAEAMRFIATAPTPVLVHCNEGQDRAGFISALLECLMGASYEEVEKDYMTTFFNYYGVAEGTDQYAQIANNIAKNLKTAFQVEDITTADLAKEAEEYLLELGVTAEEIAAVRANLGA